MVLGGSFHPWEGKLLSLWIQGFHITNLVFVLGAISETLFISLSTWGAVEKVHLTVIPIIFSQPQFLKRSFKDVGGEPEDNGVRKL